MKDFGELLLEKLVRSFDGQETVEKILEYAKENNIEISAEQALEFLKKLRANEKSHD